MSSLRHVACTMLRRSVHGPRTRRPLMDLGRPRLPSLTPSPACHRFVSPPFDHLREGQARNARPCARSQYSCLTFRGASLVSLGTESTEMQGCPCVRGRAPAPPTPASADQGALSSRVQEDVPLNGQFFGCEENGFVLTWVASVASPSALSENCEIRSLSMLVSSLGEGREGLLALHCHPAARPFAGRAWGHLAVTLPNYLSCLFVTFQHSLPCAEYGTPYPPTLFFVRTQ